VDANAAQILGKNGNYMQNVASSAFPNREPSQPQVAVIFRVLQIGMTENGSSACSRANQVDPHQFWEKEAARVSRTDGSRRPTFNWTYHCKI
jgi:hypothetical protein